MKQVRVVVQATDPLTAAGLAGSLDERAEIEVLPRTRAADADVFVVATDRTGSDTVALLRAADAEHQRPRVLVTGAVDPVGLLAMVESGVVVVLYRAATTGDVLARAVRDAAAGRGALPPDLLGTMLQQVRTLQREVLAPHGLSSSGLTPREVDVLRLLADGHDTAEIAERLRYSERTVKNVIHTMLIRLGLGNRAHAVAYAVRAGSI
ncbi:DNA-binding NarL/FixJ family response regulator [Saccharothrix australiensis]|uniref:DNA-binding NarL/FixJ family response regulator n=1 Tax=Saccharothrix australiensis TaxID=2072 RepID=A0A495W6N9_9PSEU|nr:response regulator transcription factor [Saccharothrix australiensis]RKT56750.1 DNA-binding NarL/FixJ family response regulator [Saccharothrix australiensis]